MLTLNGITKDYVTGDETVHALRGVSIHFRPHEFVAILGPSGCGKTTLLNIVGGLDHYTDGDLVIGGTSTKEYKDKDWDSYRNHRVGFVFQSYNLIPHQTVLANVELALTLSGVNRHERRARAIAALESVGLAEQIKKKPNQMSGGQMQRVAIARALVNDPDIILADEPTGALDTTTSTQIMEILHAISDRKLIVMVTHNPEIAEQYATRIIRVKDGMVIEDTNPYDGFSEEVTPLDDTLPEDCLVNGVEKKIKKKKAKKEKTSMSLWTAFSLSLNNLMTKKARTFLTAFAGSIGIIGIALILALSNGIQLFINQVQEDTLSTYPLIIEEQSQDYSAMLSALTEVGETEDHRDSDKIYVDDSMGTMMSAMNKVQRNNLEKFKAYIDANYDLLEPHLSALQYTYQFDLQVFSGDGKTQVNPTTIFDNMGEAFSGVSELMDMGGMKISAMSEMIDNRDLLNQQYDVVAGAWPESANEIVLVISKNNQISKMTLYMLGVLPQSEIADIIENMMNDPDSYNTAPMDPYEYDDFIGKTFYLMNTSDFFRATDKTYKVDGVNYPIWEDIREKDPTYNQETYVTANGVELKISGIIRPRQDATATSISTNLAYTKGLTDLILDMNAESAVLNQQKAHPDYNVLSGERYKRTYYTPATIGELIKKVDDATMEQFYSIMREEILNNPEYSDRLQIKDANSLIGFYAMMPAHMQASVMEDVLAAVGENGADTTLLFAVLNQAYGSAIPGVTLTPANLKQLLPSLPARCHMLALSGLTKEQAQSMGMTTIMMDIPGLISLAGEEAMEKIYASTSEQVKTMEITDEVFLGILGTMKADDEAFIRLEETLYGMATDVDATLDSTLKLLGDGVLSKPASISFYAKDFESKDAIEQFIDGYNESVIDEKDEIKYNDIIGTLLSSINTILNVITYVLVAFVGISLVVSSIMIGIITYISVLERIKEIGILRAIGASKGNVSQVFLAETVIVGFIAGVIGIVATLLLCIPTNLVIRAASGFENISAQLPVVGALILIGISMLLTLIAGLIPAMIAAKKEPVDALRAE